MRPKCKLCGIRHFSYEPHVKAKNLNTVVQAQMKVSRVLDSVASSVTTVTPAVTQGYMQVSPLPGHPCPMCGQTVPKYKTNAERQKAYRARKK